MGGAKHQTVKQVSDWPKWMLPYVDQFIKQYQDQVFPGGELGKMPANLNQGVAGFNPEQTAAFKATGDVAASQAPLFAGSREELMKTVRGDYLDPNTNPYLKKTYDAAAADMTDAYRTGTAPMLGVEAAKSGAFGGSDYNEAAALSRYGYRRNLENLATDVYGGNYAAERGRQLSAEGMVPGMAAAEYMPSQALAQVGSTEQQLSQAQLDTAFQNAMRQYQFPFTQLDAYGNALGVARGPAGGSATTQPIRTGTLGYK